MSLATEFFKLAELLESAAAQISTGIEGSFMGEEHMHPTAKTMARVEGRCRDKAAELRRMAAASRPGVES